MKKSLFLLALVPVMAFAQSVTESPITKNPKLSKPEDFRFFKHMNVGISAGISGFGIEIGTPLNRHLNLRAGFSWMPSFSSVRTYKMSDAGSIGMGLTPEQREKRIKNICENYLSKFCGTEVDEKINMNRSTGFYHGKILLDWYPFHKKHWHFTGGIYVGSKVIASMCNTQEEAPTMLALGMYNQLYDQVQTLEEGEPITLFDLYSLPVSESEEIKAKLKNYGRIGLLAGKDSEGNDVFLTPNDKGMMKADAIVNVVKPYIGFGYSTELGYDKRWSLSADAGIMVLGKASVPYYERGGTTIDLTKDIQSSGGIVGGYLKLIKNMPVLPIIEFRLAYTIF